MAAYGQVDTMVVSPTKNLTLSEVTVRGSAHVSLSTADQQWMEAELIKGDKTNMADLLQGVASVHVKNAVPGGIATVSLRGAGTGRNSTTWNGMPLQGSTLGLLDYSLLNVMLMEEIKITLGGDAGRYGTGSIGGNVALNNRRNYTLNEGFSFASKTLLGSFGRFQQAAKLSFDKGKWWLTSRVAYSAAKNDFDYEIRPDLPRKKTTNAAYEQLSFLQSVGYQISEKESLSLHFWTQYNYREVPPTIVQSVSEAAVTDGFVRIQMVHERGVKCGMLWTNMLNYLADNNLYDDPRNGVMGVNNSNQWYAESKLSNSVKNSYWEVGVSNRHTTATTLNYESGRKQNQLNLFGYYALKMGLLDLSLSLRREWVDKNGNPISGKLAATYNLNEQLNVGASLNRFYRVPGLNDQFWAPGGNIDLTPECGWGTDITLQYNPIKQLRWSTTIYQKRIQNWIQWGLLESANFYSALNLPLVWSRGLESAVDFDFKTGKSKWLLHTAYQYNRSTYEFELINPVIKSGEQTFYAPVHQGQASLEWSRKDWTAIYHHRYQSSVRTFLDPLDAWSLGGLSLAYHQGDIHYRIDIDNIWDTNYKIIERRSSPGRNFSIGMNIRLN